MVVQALKWIGSVVGAAVAGAIVSLICSLLGLPPYEIGIGVGLAIAASLQTLKPSPMARHASQDQCTQSARRYRKAQSARRAQNH